MFDLKGIPKRFLTKKQGFVTCKKMHKYLRYICSEVPYFRHFYDY